MPIPKKVVNFLKKKKAKYEVVEHRTVYTAFDKTQTLDKRGNNIAKTLVMKNGRDLAIATLPANKNLDKRKFKRLFNKQRKKRGKKPAKKIKLASERLIKNRFKGIKLGAIPPFGNLFGYPTFVHRSLFNHSRVMINSGHHDFSLEISPSSWKRAVPDLVVGNFTKPRS